MLAVAAVQQSIPAPPPGQAITVLELGGQVVVTRVVQGTLVFGLLPVVPMTLISAMLRVVVSKLTPGSAPRPETLRTYFPASA